MKSNNITVSVPQKGCTRDCPYCISKMTPDISQPYIFTNERIELALRFAQTLGATSLLITSRGEPMLNIDDVLSVLKIARNLYLPAEIQTNGDIGDYVADLFNDGLSVYAVSIDNIQQVTDQSGLFSKVANIGMILRWTVALHDDTLRYSAGQWLDLAREHGVRQLSFRRLTSPENPVAQEPVKWINNNVHDLDRWMSCLDDYISKLQIIRTLSFGPKIYKAGTISLTYFPYCIQESGNEDELRSLILREDGHVYTDWNSIASVLF